jgi:hypothetical protein
MKLNISPKKIWRGLVNWFRTQSPTTRRDWLLLALLLLTNVYVWTGLRVYWVIYQDHRTDLITQSVKFYPLPAGRVGTTFIPLSRYWRDVQAIQQYVTVSGTADRYKDVAIEDQVMTRLMRAAAVRRLAERYGLSVANDEIEAAYQATAAEEQNLLERNLEQYYGFTPADFKVWIAETLMERKVTEQLPRKRHISHILYSVDAGAPASADERMKKLAEDAVRRLREGKDFVELAKAESNDATSRDNGGDIGWVSRGTTGNPIIDDAFEQTAFSAPVGEVTGPIRGTRGWHIILVREETGQLDGTLTLSSPKS